jgi:hypothetical protein
MFVNTTPKNGPTGHMTASILLFKNGFSGRQQEPWFPPAIIYANAAVLTSGGSREQGASGGGGIIHGEL